MSEQLADKMLISAIVSNSGLANPNDELLNEIFGTTNKAVITNRLRKLEKDNPRDAYIIREVRESIENKYGVGGIKTKRKLLSRKIEEAIRSAKSLERISEGDILALTVGEYEAGTIINDIIRNDLLKKGYAELPIAGASKNIMAVGDTAVCADSYLNPESLHLKALVTLFGIGKRKVNRDKIELADFLFQKAIEHDLVNLNIVYNYLVSLTLVYINQISGLSFKLNYDLYRKIIKLLGRIELYIKVIQLAEVELTQDIPDETAVQELNRNLNLIHKRYFSNFFVKLFYMIKLMFVEPSFHFEGSTAETYERLQSQDEFINEIKSLEHHEKTRLDTLRSDQHQLGAWMRTIRNNRDNLKSFIAKQEADGGEAVLIEIANKLINHFERSTGKINSQRFKAKERILYLVQAEIVSESLSETISSELRKIIEALSEQAANLAGHWFGHPIEMTAVEKIISFPSVDYAVSFSIKLLETILNEAFDHDSYGLQVRIKTVSFDASAKTDQPNYEQSRVALSRIPNSVATVNSISVTPEVYEIIDKQLRSGMQKVFGDLNVKTNTTDVFFRYAPVSDSDSE